MFCVPNDASAKLQPTVKNRPFMMNKVPQWTYLTETASTQTEVQQRLGKAKPSDVIAVQTKHQHAGRGRLGRTWQQPDHEAIIFSAGFCLSNKPHELMALPLLLGLASAETLNRLGFNEIKLKWPNDLMIHGKKCGGLLVEAHTNITPKHTWIVAGLGINTTSAPTLDKDQAGCLAESKMGWNTDAQTISSHLVEAWVEECATLKTNDLPHRFKHLGIWQGQQVTAMLGKQPIQGTLMGVDHHGALIVLDANNHRHLITSGEVSRVRLATD